MTTTNEIQKRIDKLKNLDLEDKDSDVLLAELKILKEWKQDKEEVLQKINNLFKEAYTIHDCEDKDCSCYFPEVDEQNCYIIKKSRLEDLKKELER